MVVFVILHYLVTEETEHCVDSILFNVDGEKKIIVVDNASPNGSYEKLLTYYRDIEQVEIIRNKTNGGYAAGINLGYHLAKERDNPDYIVCMNNDMEIRQKEFVKNIGCSFRKYGFWVLGPDIYSTAARKHQNPEKDSIRTLSAIDTHIRQLEHLRERRLYLKLKGILRKNGVIRRLYYEVRKHSGNANDKSTGKVVKNCTLHGSCLIFSKLFIDARDYALNPVTEFYCESQILDYECNRDRMLEIYDPSVRLLHHEDVATDAAAGSYAAKMIKKCDKEIQSLNKFKDIMLRDQQEV